MFLRLDWLPVSVRALVLSAVACVALTALVAFVFDLSPTRALALAPVIVAAVGAAIFLVLLWTKVIWESMRRSSTEELEEN